MINQYQENQGALIKAIRDQTLEVPFDMVYVIDIVSVRFGGRFTPLIQSQLQKYRSLQMLTLNDCGITSLENFPFLPNLIRLDMVFNGIKGEDLIHLRRSRHIQTLMIGANRIETIDQVKQLTFLNNLMQLDLINNPVYRQPGYREKIFESFPSLLILDTLDRSGKDAFNNVTMMEAVHRVPEHLFSRQDQHSMFGHVHREQKSHLHRALSRLGSLEDMEKARPGRSVPKKRNEKKRDYTNKPLKTDGKINKVSVFSRAGIVFPVHKIKRMLKQKNSGVLKVKKTSAVYLTGVLEYLAAEFLQVAGSEAKNQKRSRITPLILKDSLNNDEELRKLLNYCTFGTMGE